MDGLLLQKPEKEAAGQKKAENFIRMGKQDCPLMSDM